MRALALAILLTTLPGGVESCYAQMKQASLAPSDATVYVVEFHPPPAWREVYREVAACAGLLDKGYEKIRWYWVDTGGKPYWQSPMGNTYGMSRPYHSPPQTYLPAMDTTSLRHEMLHQILAANGWRTSVPDSLVTQADLHPTPYFALMPDHFFRPTCEVMR